MSDGSSEIRVLGATKLNEKRRFTVREAGKQIDQLNELEYVEGEIFANVWQTDRIARISPQTGKIIGWMDLTGLRSPMYRRDGGAVLNAHRLRRNAQAASPASFGPPSSKFASCQKTQLSLCGTHFNFPCSENE